MKKGFFVIILFFAGLFWASEESFPVFKFDDYSRDAATNWSADSSGFLFSDTAGGLYTSRAWSPTSFNPRKLIGEDVWHGLVTISWTPDTVNDAKGANKDTLRFALQKMINNSWVTVEDTLSWKLASNPDSTVKLVTGAYDGVPLYYKTDPTSNNTTYPLERHPSSIHRLIAYAAGSDTCNSYLNHVWDAY